MGDSTPAIPFELVFHRRGTWHGRWAAQKVGIAVGGTPAAPAPPLMATLHDVISRWAEFKQAIATFVRGLDADAFIPLDPATAGGFAAGSCGFAGELIFQSIAITAIDSPQRVVATFCTGWPDGYATYEVVVDRGSPTEISAFAS